MNKIIWLSGKISSGMIFGKWDTIIFKHPNGFQDTLLFRMMDIQASFGWNNKIGISYWITDKRMKCKDVQEQFIRQFYGGGNIHTDLRETHVRYSEWTSDAFYESAVQIGGHDLDKELRSHFGKHIWLRIEIIPNNT